MAVHKEFNITEMLMSELVGRSFYINANSQEHTLFTTYMPIMIAAIEADVNSTPPHTTCSVAAHISSCVDDMEKSYHIARAKTKAGEELSAVAAGTTHNHYYGSGSSGGNSSSSTDEWGVGSYLLLAAAAGAVCYGGYKLFSDGEAEDLIAVDLDYTI